MDKIELTDLRTSKVISTGWRHICRGNRRTRALMQHGLLKIVAVRSPHGDSWQSVHTGNKDTQCFDMHIPAGMATIPTKPTNNTGPHTRPTSLRVLSTATLAQLSLQRGSGYTLQSRQAPAHAWHSRCYQVEQVPSAQNAYALKRSSAAPPACCR